MKKLLLPLLVVIAIGGFAWHSQRSDLTPPPNKEPLRIGIVPYPGFGAFSIAEEKEFFKEHQVNVELVQLSPDTMFSALASNDVQMLVGSADTMPIIADAGIPAKQIFSTSISYGADGLIVKNDIQEMKDLKGQKVYLAYGLPSHFFFRYLAREAGLTNADIELVNLNPEEVGSSFVAGKIDAGMTWEPWLTNAQGREDGKIMVTSRDEPGLITDVIIARNDLIEHRREDTKSVMRAFFESVEWWEANLAEGNAIVAKSFGLSPEEFAPMKDTVKLLDLSANLEKFRKDTPLNVYDIVNKASEIYLSDGIIKTAATGEAMTDASLLSEVLQ